MALLPTGWLTVDGLRVRYAVDGDGPDVVLFHGFPETLQGWHGILPELARSFRVHAFDWPGFGKSDRPMPWSYSFGGYAEFARRFLDAAGLERAHLVGTDIGMPAALLLALDHPDRVDRVVVFDGPAAFRPGYLSWEVRALQTRGPGEILVYGFPGLALRLTFIRGFYGRCPLPADVFRDFQQQISEAALRRATLQLFRSGRPYLDRLEAQVAGLRAPLLILWGERDVFIDPRMGEELQRRVPGSHWEALPRAGHFLHQEKPDEFLDRVQSFLAPQEA